MTESISYIKLGELEHPIDAVTVNGLSFTSEEKTRWNNKQDALTFDSTPTENSDNLVKSGSLYTVLTDTELVVATALNDLNERILSVDSSISEVYDEIDRALTAVLTYKGTVGSNGDVSVLPSSHEVGDVYVVSIAGTYAGKTCEVGDYIICKTSGTSASDGDWNVVNGENQVSNSSASLAAPGSSVTIATVDGTNITVSTPASWTGVSKSGTLTGVTLNGVSASISNGVAQLSLVFDSIPTENSDNLLKSGVIYSAITDNELVVSTALNDLNDRVSDLENNTGSGGITGVMFNGVSASISNGIASISATIPSYFVINGNNYSYTSSSDYEAYVDFGTLVNSISFNGSAVSISNGNANISVSIPAAVTESTVAGWGFTKNAGTLTTHASHKLTTTNGTATAVNQGTEITFIESLTGTTTATSGDLTVTATRKKVTIPTAVTESTVAGWGFTKNSGTLTGVEFNGTSASISNGIASINARIPSYITINGSIYTYTESSDYEAFFDIGDVVTAVSFNGTNVSLSNGLVSMSETDPVFSASVAASISATDISNWNSKTSNTGTITGISMNGSSKGTSGNVNLGTVVTGLSMNGSSVSISNGIANLGTVLTSHQSIKTINGQTITGTGDVTISGLPAATSSDNGKILQVVNGSWTLVTPVNIYSGNVSPDNGQGTNGDLYIQTS